MLAFLIYGATAWRLSPILPVGDEPHYLLITQSVLGDGDLRIENNHRNGDHFAYMDFEIAPHFLRRGLDGQIYSVHAPGLAVLVAPAFALAGEPGVRGFLALLLAVATALAWWLAYRVTGRPDAAWFGWAVVSLSAPFYFHAFAVFPDAPAAALVLTGVWALVDLPTGGGSSAAVHHDGPAGGSPEPGVGSLSDRRWWLHGAALGALPWLHTRYAVLAVGLGVCLVLRIAAGPAPLRRISTFLAVPAASAVGWFGYFRLIYGTFSPPRPTAATRRVPLRTSRPGCRVCWSTSSSDCSPMPRLTASRWSASCGSRVTPASAGSRSS